MADGAPDRERRAFERHEARLELRFRAASEMAQALKAFSVNFSNGGLCLRTKRAYELGTRLLLNIRVGASEELELTGEVAWTRGGAVGVRFVDVGAAIRNRLDAFVASLKSGGTG